MRPTSDPQDPWPVVERVRDLLEAQGRLAGLDAEKAKQQLTAAVVEAERLKQEAVEAREVERQRRERLEKQIGKIGEDLR